MVRRTNGFQKPFNPMQIGTWILLVVLLLQFGFFATPILPLAASIPCTITVFLCGVSTAYFAYQCCIVDPIDSRLRCHLANQGDRSYATKSNQSSTRGVHAEQDGGPTKFCWVCGIDVNEISMHCKFCDKCVMGFDHHCHWLNTCVGKENYEYFFRTVGSTLALVLVHGSVLAGLVISFFVQYSASQKQTGDEYYDNSTLQRSNDWFGLEAGLVVAIVNVIFLAVDLSCISLLCQLFFFHIRLRREKITTYAYIVRDGQRKHEASREKMQMGRRRIAAIGDAKREGQQVRACLLKAAGCPFVGEFICKPCDPLRLDELSSKKQSNNKKDNHKEARFQQDEQTGTVELGDCPPSNCAHNVDQESLDEIEQEKVSIEQNATNTLSEAMQKRREIIQEDATSENKIQFVSVLSDDYAEKEAP